MVDALSRLIAEIKPKEKPISEPTEDFAFTITQLDELSNILFDLAPCGFIAERSLVFLLQDILAKTDNETNQRVPVQWTKLSSENINELSLELFGDLEYVSWKEFITRNFLIRNPDVDELLQLRKQFLDYDQELTETICSEDYDNISFWFTTTTSNTTKSESIRKLLFKLYKCNENRFNYTAMLLDFCKGIVFLNDKRKSQTFQVSI